MGQWGLSSGLTPQRGHGGKAVSFQWSVQLCGPYSGHRAGHYFVLCQILPRRKRKHLCQMLWPLPLQRPQPISALRLAGPEAAGLQAPVRWVPFRNRALAPFWGVGDIRVFSQLPRAPCS